MTFIIKMMFYLAYTRHKKKVSDGVFYLSVPLGVFIVLISMVFETIFSVPLFVSIVSYNVYLGLFAPMSLAAIVIYFVAVRGRSYQVFDRYFKIIGDVETKKFLNKYKIRIGVVCMLIPSICIFLVYIWSKFIG